MKHRKYIIHIAKHERSHTQVRMQHEQNMNEHVRIFLSWLLTWNYWKMESAHYRMFEQRLKASEPRYLVRQRCTFYRCDSEAPMPSFPNEPPPILRLAGWVPGSGKPKARMQINICTRSCIHTYARANIHTSFKNWTLVIEITERRILKKCELVYRYVYKCETP